MVVSAFAFFAKSLHWLAVFCQNGLTSVINISLWVSVSAIRLSLWEEESTTSTFKLSFVFYFRASVSERATPRTLGAARSLASHRHSRFKVDPASLRYTPHTALLTDVLSFAPNIAFAAPSLLSPTLRYLSSFRRGLQRNVCKSTRGTSGREMPCKRLQNNFSSVLVGNR